ncbi:DUF1294 domain-containing protein [Paenalkalicoccus suaedae]|uniref:DUF1294 domain-containing protein n=1 Tax=Paenalkalicoccus suaedae TaxID=2592382 RepID=A0A859FGT6_9BACI|nr:DUF1294 domain-containing protein [Paenalkalicoccus suaedae]QKS72010.1 DUF1294 domain-containing protein [Paenalkalicoccus suaedae]
MEALILFGYLLVINIIAATLFIGDKQAARAKKRRISEKNLLTIAFLGGALGMLITGQVIRHKTKKPVFKLLLPVFVLAHATLLIYLGFI